MLLLSFLNALGIVPFLYVSLFDCVCICICMQHLWMHTCANVSACGGGQRQTTVFSRHCEFLFLCKTGAPTGVELAK